MNRYSLLTAAALSLAMTLAWNGGISAAQKVRPPSQAWLDYAAALNTIVPVWLSDGSEASTRFRAMLDKQRAAADQAGPPLVVKLWVDAASRVTRVRLDPAVASLDQQAVIADAIVGRRLDRARPRHIPLPIKLEIQIRPASAE